MGRVDYFKELIDEGQNPCTHCGSDDLELDWDENVYYCTSCGKKVEDIPVKKKKVRTINKMKDDE